MANAKKFYPKKRVFKTKRKSVKKIAQVSVKKAVESVLSRKVEPKSSGINPAVYVWNANNSTISASVNIADVFALTQGVTDGTRIGNKIDITRAVLNINLLSPSSGNPCIVTIFIGYLKGQRTSNPSTGGNTAFIFQDGPVSTGTTGLTLDLLRNTNNDLFTVKRYDIKIGGAYNAVGVAPAFNNNFPAFVNKKISLSQLLGTLTYTNDGSVLHNKNLWMFCQCTSIDSSLLAIPSVFPILNYYVDGTYKDM